VSINVYKQSRFYIPDFIGFQWVDPLTGAVITLPPDLDQAGFMYFDSKEVSQVDEGLGNSSVIYLTGNGKAVQQSKPEPRRWSFIVKWIGPATDDKIQTIIAFQSQGLQPTAKIGTGYFSGDAGNDDWTANLAVIDPCAIEYDQLLTRKMGRGQGIITEGSLTFTVYESETLSVPRPAGNGGNGGAIQA